MTSTVDNTTSPKTEQKEGEKALDVEEPKKKAQNPITKGYRSPDADISLFSSDGVEFKVHRFQLMAAR